MAVIKQGLIVIYTLALALGNNKDVLFVMGFNYNIYNTSV